MSDWASKIRDLWLASGKTQGEWGAPYGLTGPEVARIATGRIKKPRHDMWVKIQAALGGNGTVSPPQVDQPQQPVGALLLERLDAIEREVAALARRTSAVERALKRRRASRAG